MVLLLAAPPAAPQPLSSLADEQDGHWEELLPPHNLVGPLSIYDPVEDRVVVLDERSRMNLLELAGTPGWRRLGNLAPTLYPTLASAYSIRSRNQMLVVQQGAWEIWVHDFGDNSWSLIKASGSPPTTTFSAVAYDSVADRVLVFAGTPRCRPGEICYENRVWTLSLSGTPAWQVLDALGSPPATVQASMVFDGSRNRLVVVGGFDGHAGIQDSWVLDLSGTPQWSSFDTQGSFPGGGRVVGDPEGDRILLYRGQNDVWALPLGDPRIWAHIAASGTAASDPRWEAVVLDTRHRRLIAAGGHAHPGDTWALPLTGAPATWSRMISIPTGAHMHTAVLSPHTDQLVVFGGARHWGPAVSETWVKDLDDRGLWHLLSPSGTPPSPPEGHAACLDATRNEMLVFGGHATGSGLASAWSLSLGSSPQWKRIDATGQPPSERWGHAAVFDPRGDRMLVFGGSSNSAFYLGDVWQLQRGTTEAWTRLFPEGLEPTGRTEMSAVYDSRRRRVIVFGGGTAGADLEETWALNLEPELRWTHLTTSGSPGTHFEHEAVYDSLQDRMLVWDGFRGVGGSQVEDVWELSFLTEPPTWRRLLPDGPFPAERAYSASAFDPARNRILIFGGFTPGMGGDTFDWTDTWALTWETPIATPVQVSLVNATLEPDAIRVRWSVVEVTRAAIERNEDGRGWIEMRVATPDGTGQIEFVDDLVRSGSTYRYRLRISGAGGDQFLGETPPLSVTAPKLSVRGFGSNPSNGRDLIHFSLASRELALLDVIDVRGATVLEHRVHDLMPGEHSIDVGSGLAPGIYWIRLRQGMRSAIAKVCIVR